MKGLLGKKVGMTQVYGDNGKIVPVTVVDIGPCTVIATRTLEKDGYSALQLGYGQRKIKNVAKAVCGSTKAAGYQTEAPAIIREIRLDSDPAEAVGDKLGADIFGVGDYVDIIGTTKGKGFQGVVKRYRFGGGRESHGGDWSRRGGSIGMCVSPGKVYRGRKMPGHMGNARRTVQNLKIIQIREDENIILIKGAIPGPNGGNVIIKQAKKKINK